MAGSSAPTDTTSQADDIVVSAKPHPIRWGYDLYQKSFDDPNRIVADYRITDKHENLDVGGKSGWVSGVVPKDAHLNLDSTGQTLATNIQAEAGADVHIQGGGSHDYFKPSIIPATNAADLARYKPGQVSIDGGGGGDTVLAPGDSIITRLPDDKQGQHYRFTDKNGYSFDTSHVDNVANSTPSPPKAAPQDQVNGQKTQLPDTNHGAASFDSIGLQVGHSMSVGEATRPLIDSRIPKYEQAQANAENSYRDKLASCLADKGDLNLCKDIKYTPPTVEQFGAAPTHTEFTAPLPTPTVQPPQSKDAPAPSR